MIARAASLRSRLRATPGGGRGWALWGALVGVLLGASQAATEETQMILKPDWHYVSDGVMGGVSRGGISTGVEQGRPFTRLTGQVSLDNNGGFIQMAMDLDPGGAAFDASAYDGVEITLRVNGEPYDLRLRTDALRRPWQSFRVEIPALADWQTRRIPFPAFVPHRTEATLDPARLRRIGLLAIGRAFTADVSVREIGFYRSSPP